MPESMTHPTHPTTSGTAIDVSVEGDVPSAVVEYARERLETVIRHVGDPVLLARLRLTQAPDPARDRPALAQVALDVDGKVVRAHVAARGPREAVDLLQRRLADQLEQRASRRRALRRRGATSDADEWRHGDLPTHRPDVFDRPVEERQLVRRKTFALDELTADEAAFDMEQLDHDFHLFRELASGEDALLERREGDRYVLTRLHPVDVDPGPTAIALTVADQPPPEATVDDAIARLDAAGDRYLFFADPSTGRGQIVYRRYDGHHGLITPA